MEGNALEVALALMRLPSMRVPLRLQPLPAGVEQVIVLAAGASAPLQAAAERRGEAPAELLEAARFYIREVMLFHGADAYRVLGVSSSASEAQIKLHHRHLQHWLHPDRRGNDWESVFATRINAAWNELRTPARRAAYDAQAMQQAVVPRRVLVSEWRPMPAAGAGHSGWWLAMALAGCLGLAWLALRQANAPAPQWQPSTRPPLASGPAPSLASDHETGVPQAMVARPGIGGVEPSRTPLAPVVAASAPAALVQVAIVADAGWNLDSEAPPLPAVPAQPPPGPGAVASESPRPGTSPAAQPAYDSALHGISPVQPSPPPSVSLQQVQLAQHRGRELTRFLASQAEHAPPIWRNASAQDAATALRDRLQGASVQFAAPEWLISGERARMTSALQHRGKQGSPATLQVELAWHEGMWLVDRVEMEDLP